MQISVGKSTLHNRQSDSHRLSVRCPARSVEKPTEPGVQSPAVRATRAVFEVKYKKSAEVAKVAKNGPVTSHFVHVVDFWVTNIVTHITR